MLRQLLIELCVGSGGLTQIGIRMSFICVTKIAKTLSIRILSIKGLYAALSINGSQHNNDLLL